MKRVEGETPVLLSRKFKENTIFFSSFKNPLIATYLYLIVNIVDLLLNGYLHLTVYLHINFTAF